MKEHSTNRCTGFYSATLRKTSELSRSVRRFAPHGIAELTTLSALSRPAPRAGTSHLTRVPSVFTQASLLQSGRKRVSSAILRDDRLPGWVDVL